MQMKKNITKLYIATFFIILSGSAMAQDGGVGINTSTPAATLDVVASPNISTRVDGLIAPRLKGSELQTKDALYTAIQDGAIVYVTEAVTTTTDKTTNVTSIGYYYFDKTQGTVGRWMKIANPAVAAAYQEPWNIQGTSTPSTANTDAIYQNNIVAIKKQTGIAGVDLDVLGSIRGGNALVYSSGTTPVVVGNNSIAVGDGNSATGDNTAAFGYQTTSAGVSSFAAGYQNTTKGNYSIVAGKGNTLGSGNTATSGHASSVFGEVNQVNHILSFVNGYGNKLVDADGQAGTNFVSGDSNELTGNASWNFVSGRLNKISGITTFTAGSANTVSGNGAVAIGSNLISDNSGQISLGKNNFSFLNAYLTIGNGASTSARSNVIAAVVDQTNATTLANSWVAIGSNNVVPDRLNNTIKLRVYGGIQTAASTYADYVFEDYFTGHSAIKPGYKFNSLYSVESFVKENHHLPGVTSIKDLEKTSNGYAFDLTQLSTQTLEKVEELYLHTIEQQKQIDELKNLVRTQQEQINKLLSK